MINNSHKDRVQREALKAWLDTGKKGTVEIVTGLGKTFIFLHALYTMPKNDGKINLFLAETTEREADLEADILKYNKIFNVNVRNDYILQFKCYQTVYKWEKENFGLVGCDEIHEMLSPEYSRFVYNNTFDGIIGMSATINRKIAYEINNKIVTKGMMIDDIAPVCYKYTINQGQIEGTSRKLNVYVIHQELDEVTKNIPAGNQFKRFYQTEKESYSYWDKEHKRSWFIEDKNTKDLKIRITSTKRSNLLFNLPSKIVTIQELVNSIKGKTILFGNSLDSLLKITKNVVSSRNTDDVNKLIRDNFDKDKIKLIGSFKKLRQGANLKELDNVIIMSYYSSEGHIVQQFGRLRKNGEKVGSAFVLLTKGTQETVWFEKAFENITEFNIIYCDDLKDCLNKYNINEKT